MPQQMQAGMHGGFASLGLLVAVFLVGAYLAVSARLASIWKRTRYQLPLSGNLMLSTYMVAKSYMASLRLRNAMYVQLNICHPRHTPLASAVAQPSLSVFHSNCGGMQVFKFASIQSNPPVAIFSAVLPEL